MPLFPRRQRKNRKIIEVLTRIKEKRDQVLPAVRTTVKRQLDEAAIPEETKSFLEPMIDDDRLIGFIFTKFAAGITEAEGDAIVDDPQRGKLLEMIIGFVERGGLQLILEFILAIMAAI